MATLTSPRRRSFGTIFLVLLLLILGAMALWTWFSLSWAYADGERAGVLQKFVHRGWLCKTYEGEIALYYGGGQYLGPGNSAQLWDFSVRDPLIAAQLSKAVGRRVQLHYTEHKGLPTSCFADTHYFVDRVTVVADNESGMATPPSPLPRSRCRRLPPRRAARRRPQPRRRNRRQPSRRPRRT